MKAGRLFEDIAGSYMHLERYVNNGSPSGHSERRTTSPATSPFNGAERFSLLEFADEDLETRVLGSENLLFQRGVNYAHPDSAASAILLGARRRLAETNFAVSPTAGGRTMVIRDLPPRGYLKLTYDVGRLGRVDRQLSLKLCQSSLEVGSALKQSIDAGKMPAGFSLLLESSAKVSIIPTADASYEWGVIYREPRPYPYRSEVVQLVPGFSLFGIDRKSRGDEVLINQFIERSQAEPRAYLLKLLTLIVDCYWSIVLSCAFHAEMHAQNCLFEVDEGFNIARLVLIDLQSVDKDLPLARRLGLRDTWESCPEGCFDESIYFYPIRSSFIYDFKVGTYLMTPLIAAVATKYPIDVEAVEREIRDYVRGKYTSLLPGDYFPADGCWYDCDTSERLPGQKRQYYPHENPAFR